VKLVLAEEMAIGEIAFETYNAYVKAAGGWVIAIGTIFLCTVASGAQVFADFWLAFWIDRLPKVNNYLFNTNRTEQ